MKVKLVCQDPLASPREITLDRFPVEIGRGAAADVRIDDRWTSRRHCELQDADGRIWVRDLGSRHGTFVNGKLVIDETPLLPGDELCVGLSHFVAEYELEAPLPPPPLAAGSVEHALRALACLPL